MQFSAAPGRRLVIQLSKSWGGLNRRISFLDHILKWEIPDFAEVRTRTHHLKVDMAEFSCSEHRLHIKLRISSLVFGANLPLQPYMLICRRDCRIVCFKLVALTHTRRISDALTLRTKSSGIYSGNRGNCFFDRVLRIVLRIRLIASIHYDCPNDSLRWLAALQRPFGIGPIPL